MSPTKSAALLFRRFVRHRTDTKYGYRKKKVSLAGLMGATVRILGAQGGHLATGQLKLDGYTDKVMSIVVSSDGMRVALDSRDKTIRIFEVSLATDLKASSSKSQVYKARSRLKDGWMQKSPTELLFYVFTGYTSRIGLWQPHDIIVIGQSSTRLDLTIFMHGDDWAYVHD